MSNPTIHAEMRTSTGKGSARKLRRAERMPAVAYGGTADSMPLTIDPHDIEKLRKSPLGWNQPVQIEVDGGQSVDLAMLKAVDKHPISGVLLHADFVRLEAGVAVLVNVPVRIEGSAAGVALGGLLNVQIRTLPVRCLPKDIPTGIEVDVSKLEVGDRLMLSKVKLPAGVVATISDTPVVSVVGRRGSREEEVEEEGEVAADGEEETSEAAATEGGAAAAKESGE